MVDMVYSRTQLLICTIKMDAMFDKAYSFYCKEWKIYSSTHHYKNTIKGTCYASTEVIALVTSWKKNQPQDGLTCLQICIHYNASAYLSSLIEIRRPAMARRSPPPPPPRVIRSYILNLKKGFVNAAP